MRLGFILTVLITCGIAGCSSSDDGNSAAQQDFLDRCKLATDLACQKGFDCDNFFVTSQFVSVAQCQHEAEQNYKKSVGNFSSSQLRDCANTCDLMRSDVEALTCDKFDDAVFARYSCGN
ncbi:MAG: hypothetical protein H6718_27915 [Polyangiaceae bacterium]|nr:hypothetical protein [Myxococcales bacterium]MCB9589273.1 hypothetical protein [Polyangiaceae bacterium]